MTNQNPTQLKAEVVGAKVVDLQYVHGGDYFVCVLEKDGREFEFSFRFMADIVRNERQGG